MNKISQRLFDTDACGTFRDDPDKLTPEMLDGIARHLIKEALGDNPAVVAERDVGCKLGVARRRTDYN